MQFAATYAPGVFDTRTKLMGRQSAGVGFLRAALKARPERIYCYAAHRGLAQTFADDVIAITAGPPELRFIGWDAPGRLAEAGLLYRADPGIESDAWNRRQHGQARGWSLCGVTHSLSSLNAMTAVASIVRAPLYPWDAVICTSTVARDVYRHVIEAEMESLRDAVGATRFTLPQLPMIPLGVHPEDFAFTADERAAARVAVGLGPDDVAVLFAGRLTFHGKAHPLPMFLGLEAAAQASPHPVHLLLFGQYAHAAVGDAFAREAARFAPSVRLVHLDGAKGGNQGIAWAAADIFTSLSDNIQETFGLTPVEAMAAGLPVVVSDWNGYKDTVRDGVDGFRVPTLAPPAGCGIDLIDRHESSLDDYDRFIGNVAQLTAVDVAAAAEAYRRLVLSPALRRRMGDAGRRRVRDTFDWTLVFRRYEALWEELAERRRADPAVPGEGSRIGRPDRPDPFSLYRSFPSAVAAGGTRLRLRPGLVLADALERRALASVSFATAGVPAESTLGDVIVHLSEDWTSVSALAAALPGLRHAALVRAVLWLAKVGVVDASGGRLPAAWSEASD